MFERVLVGVGRRMVPVPGWLFGAMARRDEKRIAKRRPLTPDQRRHWSTFVENHALETCHDCDAVHLVCLVDGEDPAGPTT